MPYQLTVSEKPNYLHIRVTGRNSPATVRAYLAEIYALCVQRNSSAILIEEDLAGPGLPLFEIFDIAAKSSEWAWPPPRRIAYVDVNKEHSFPDMKFAETVARNRGGEIQIFENVKDAEEWLRVA